MLQLRLGTITSMRIPDPIPPEGVYIILNAAYTGLKAIPAITIAKNNAFPKLRLFEDHIETRVIFLKRTNISDIESIDASKTLFGSWQITIIRKNSPLTFIAMPQDEKDVFDTVLFFKRRGIQLSLAAQSINNNYE